MLATCGHEIKQGIMATINEGDSLSYGSYCDKCIMLIHMHDDRVEDGELKNILIEIQLLRALVVEARPWIKERSRHYYHDLKEVNKWLNKTEKIKVD